MTMSAASAALVARLVEQFIRRLPAIIRAFGPGPIDLDEIYPKTREELEAEVEAQRERDSGGNPNT